MNTRIFKQLLVGVVATMGLISAQAFAAQVQTTFQVTATVNAVCNNQAATNIAHGVYDPTSGTDNDATGTITVRCTKDTPFTIALNVGTGGGSFATRTLASGGDTLNFNLYREAGRTTIWGDGTGGSNTVAGTGLGLGVPQAVSNTVYSRIPNSQTTVPPGSYSSTIQVTITY